MNGLIEAIMDMREEDAVRAAREMLDTGTSPMQVLDDCRAAMAADTEWAKETRPRSIHTRRAKGGDNDCREA